MNKSIIVSNFFDMRDKIICENLNLTRALLYDKMTQSVTTKESLLRGSFAFILKKLGDGL